MSTEHSVSMSSGLSDGSISLERIKKKCMEKNRDFEETEDGESDEDYDEVIGNNIRRRKKVTDDEDEEMDEDEEDEDDREERRARKSTKVTLI